MWTYDLADWHESLGVLHEWWWADLLAQGREPECPDRREGSLIEFNGRIVRRHSVEPWLPDRPAPRKGRHQVARLSRTASMTRGRAPDTG